MKELENLSKENSELKTKLENAVKEKNENISKFAYINLDSEKLKTEIKSLKNVNLTLSNEIQNFKAEDIKKTKEETEELKIKVQSLEKEKNELIEKINKEKNDLNEKLNKEKNESNEKLNKEKKELNEKLDNYKKSFSHNYLISKKTRLILSFLNSQNQILETKFNDLKTSKELNELKITELEKIITNKEKIITETTKNNETLKKTLEEEKTKYTQLNNEYQNLIELSKDNNLSGNVSPNPSANTNPKTVQLQKSFSELSLCLNNYKKIVPFLNSKLESIEKENEDLKIQNNKLNEEIKNKNLSIENDKQIEEYKKIIEKCNEEKNGLIQENKMVKMENKLIKDDISCISNYLNREKNNDNSNEDMSQILEQLMKAKNIISFLTSENK